MLIFSFRARAGRLSFVDFFFPYKDVASHVFVVSVMFILKDPIPARDPLTPVFEKLMTSRVTSNDLNLPFLGKGDIN